MSTADGQGIIDRCWPYVEGGARASGAHQRVDETQRGLRWLIGDHQLGIILTLSTRAPLARR